MRVLFENEVALVNGAGATEEKGQALGKNIGTLVDKMTNIFGVKSDFTTAFTLMGSAIGSLIELDFQVGIKNLFDSIALTINAIGKKPEAPAA